MKKKKTMIYHIGDKFLIDTTLYEVRYLNAGMAWLSLGEPEWYFLADTKLDEFGYDIKGIKAKVVHNKECGAV